jgi:hypothetical protein
MTDHFQLCLLGKLHHCSGITSGSWSSNLFTYSLAVIRPWRVKTGPSERHNILCFTVGARHFGLYASLYVLQKQILPKVGTSVKDDSSVNIMRFNLSDDLVSWSWHNRLSISALRSVIIRSAPAAVLPRMLDLWSSHRTHVDRGSSGFKNIHLCCSTSVIFPNNTS